MAEVPNNERIVREAASAVKIPFEILWGVYGAETGHGADVKTSSGGAEGSFQFLPTTAKEYRYPYTNATTEQVFAEQALAAGHYLASLKKSTGSWEGAIQAYSGKSYNLAHVQENGRTKEAAPTPQNFLTGGSINLPATIEKGLGSLGFSWEKLGEFALTSILLLVGAVLVVYGIMLAVKPRGSGMPMPVPVPV